MFATMLRDAANQRFPGPGTISGILLGGGAPASGLVPAEVQATTVRVGRDEEIVGQGEPAKHCYLVLSGCVRTVRLMEDGRRQVGEFLLAGDLFGWEALGEHQFGAEAVTRAILLRYPQRRLEALAERDRTLAAGLHALTAGQLRANRERMVLLGRKTAAERIATFLLEMETRLCAEGEAAIELPMPRTDIADYLGLTIETVCRGMAHFRREGYIAVERARIVIRDRQALGLVGRERLRRGTLPELSPHGLPRIAKAN